MSVTNRRYTEDHEWVELEGDVATIGITKFAADELGEVVYVDLSDLDTKLEPSDEFGSIESVKTVSGLYAPVSGTVVAVNSSITEKPETLNESPEGDSWLIKIKVSDPSDLNALMDHESYQQHTQN
jgi:glycine cleavage system H protein